MVWSTRASARTQARPEEVWKLWTEVEGWPRWDRGVEWSQLDGPFLAGTRGSLKPHDAPTTPFVLTKVEPNAAFSARSPLPLAAMNFVHTMGVEDGATMIEHRVEISGPLTPLFRRLIGSRIASELPSTVERLARLAEASRDSADGTC